MNAEVKKNLVREGVFALYRELGPAKTIKFFQIVGLHRGDTLKEIEEITKKMSREEAIKFVKKSHN